MKRSVRYLLVFCLLLGVLPVLAARPVQLGIQGSITSPQENATVRGMVAITGSAAGGGFQFYKVEWSRSTDPADWNLIGTTYPLPVIDGVLVQWDTTTVPDGVYTLRLRVVKTDGNYGEYYVPQIIVANKWPTETPTPPPTPEMIEGSTATPGPTATLAFLQPSVALAQPSPTPTPVRPVSRTGVPQLPLGTWREALLMGIGTMAAILGVLGVVFALRRVL